MLFFASPIGLGHATRDIAVADELLKKNIHYNGTKKGSDSNGAKSGSDDDDNNNNKDNIIFISGEAAPRLIERKGYKVFDVYKPEKFNVQAGQLQQSFRWLMSYYSYYKRCKEIAKEIITTQHSANDDDDGLVVSDEDFASISVAQEMGIRRILITDILETHFTKGVASLVEKKMNSAMKEMIRKCDHVIIPDIGKSHDNISYVGPIVREPSADRDVLRARFKFERKTILVSVGGTDAGRYLIERALTAYRKLRQRLDADLVVVPGPSIRLSELEEGGGAAAGYYRNLGFVDNLHELIYAADLVISLAGRSTMDESIAYGTPGIFIPIKGHFEQEEGAKRLGYRYEDISRLESLMEEKIQQQRGGSKERIITNDGGVDDNYADYNGAVVVSGAQKAAEIIQSFR